MKKLLSILISGMVLYTAFPFSVAHAENNEEYVCGDGHFETVDDFNESLDSSLSLNLNEHSLVPSDDINIILPSDTEIQTTTETTTLTTETTTAPETATTTQSTTESTTSATSETTTTTVKIDITTTTTNSSNLESELPQTGYSNIYKVFVGGAFAMTIAGATMIARSKMKNKE